MPKDFVAESPLATHLMSPKLLELLLPVGLSPAQMVEVSTRFDSVPDAGSKEHIYLVMAVVPEEKDEQQLSSLKGTILVAESTPVVDKKGSCEHFNPSVEGNDYVVASWGTGSWYSYSRSIHHTH